MKAEKVLSKFAWKLLRKGARKVAVLPSELVARAYEEAGYDLRTAIRFEQERERATWNEGFKTGLIVGIVAAAVALMAWDILT